MATVDDTRQCPTCSRAMEQDWLPRHHHSAQWDDNTSVLVHVNPATNDIRYPGRHDAKLKEGYERVYLRSLDAVNSSSVRTRCLVHTMHYDNNGRALDDRMDS